MSELPFSFQRHRTPTAARAAGMMTTAHGAVETPAFMPVGTQGAVKAITHRDLEGLGAEIILGNTYHLYLRPGDERIARLGGLHRFIGWSRPILTDSGGYQVFSLAARRRIDEEGAHFRSHLDGSLHLLTPEKAADIQANLGSDVAMVLDECVAHPCDVRPAADAMHRTLRWAARARERMAGDPRQRRGQRGRQQSRAGAIWHRAGQRLSRPSRRERRGSVAIGFEAYAIGGLSVGEPPDVMYDIVSRTTPFLPASRPRYLMGTGTPQDLVESVARGIDLFDCVLPTRNARTGQLFTSEGRINIKNAQVRRGPAAARSRMRVLYMPHLQPRLPPASFSGRRDRRGLP